MKSSKQITSTRAERQRPVITKAAVQGFTLIEVMVTVFVLAVGVLGVAGMQAIGVRESANLYYRTQADLLLNDIVDRMRANRRAARGIADSGVGHAYDNVDTSQEYAAVACTQCDESQMAANDLSQWAQTVTNSRLPGGTGLISLIGDSTNVDGRVVGSIYQINVFWDEDRDGDTGTDCDPANPDDMACTSLVVEI